MKVLFYIPCQLLGSILAALTLKSVVPHHVFFPESAQNSRANDLQLNNGTFEEKNFAKALTPSIGVTLLNEQITPMQGFAVEALITFILILTIFASIDGKRKDLGGSFPLSIGLALVVGVLFGVRILYFSAKTPLNAK